MIRLAPSAARAVRVAPIARAAILGLAVACGDSPSGPDGGGGRVTIEGPAMLTFDHIGEQATLHAASRGGDAIRWSSSLPSVARVSAGVVTAEGDGSAYIIASAAGEADSVAVTVRQVATELAFLSPPEHAVQGRPFLQPVRLAVVDRGGTPVQAYSGTIAISLASAGGVLDGTAERAAVNGTATFDDLVIDAAGRGYRLEASTAGGSLHVQSPPFDVVAAPDLVVARNSAGHAVGMLIDAAGAAGEFDDLGRVAPDSVFHLVASASTSSDVIAFTRGRPPVLLSASWTAGTDTVAVPFPDPMAIPVTVWVLRGPYEQQRARAANAIATTSLIWDEERMGVDFGEVEFIDATGDPEAASFHQLTLCNQQAQITSAIGKRPGRINIYYVGTVDGGTDRGRACAGGDFTMMAERSGHELLSHEIGHLFGLGHIDGDERFDRTNVMHSASSTRRFLTEAQVFRSHYNPYTALRMVYGLRTDTPRTCADYEVNRSCPSLDRRLFADGEFPANSVGAAITEWLLTTCLTGDASAVTALRDHGDAAVDALRRAVVDGPPLHVAREIRQAELDRMAGLRARIAAGDRFGLDDAAFAALQVSLATPSTERRVAERDAAWRQAAVRGLGIIGGEAAGRVLRDIAAGDDPRLAEAARRALRR